MRSLMLTILASAALTLTSACGDDSTNPQDGGADTVDDSNQPVDSADGTATDDDTTAGDATSADSTSGDDTSTTSDSATTDTTVEPDTSPAPIVVVVNEVSAGQDWVELFNAGTTDADISGYALQDSNLDVATEYVIPAGTTITVGGYLLLAQDSDAGPGFTFGLGKADAIFLYDRSGTVKSTIAWDDGESPDGASYGRIPDGTGPFKTLYRPTPGAVNLDNLPQTCGNDIIEAPELCDGSAVPDGVACSDWGFGGGTLGCTSCESYDLSGCTPHAAALVINEVSSEVDKIELYNGSPALISLIGYQIMDDAGNAWTFPASTIAAGGYKVLTKDAPNEFTFGLGSDDYVILLDNLGNELDRADWKPDEALVSYCRSPNGNGGFVSCAAQSFGSANP